MSTNLAGRVDASSKGHQADSEFLTFLLSDEEFGVDILSVQEIRVWTPVTELPNTPSYLKGVINLRGTIVPIVDLRERFGGEPQDYSDTTVTIILRIESAAGDAVAGIVVDAVSDVYKFGTDQIRSSPNLGSRIEHRFIQGMAMSDDRIIILLDSEKLLDAEELYQIQLQFK